MTERLLFRFPPSETRHKQVAAIFADRVDAFQEQSSYKGNPPFLRIYLNCGNWIDLTITADEFQRRLGYNNGG